MARSHGEGTITQRKDGRWCAALQLDGKRAWVYGKTRSEVAEKLRKATTQARTSGKLPERHDLESLMAAWQANGASRIMRWVRNGLLPNILSSSRCPAALPARAAAKSPAAAL